MWERPLECSGECKRPLAVHYTEIVDHKLSELGMCRQCPVLQRRLHGRHPQKAEGLGGEAPKGVTCGSCGTTAEAVRTGSTVGCGQCYEIFSDLLTHDLLASKRISRHLGPSPSRAAPFHLGRAPGETITLNPKIKLVALDEALETTLQQEDYEGAAYLRDQIQAMKERLNEGKS